jgi:hypothetical protein
MVPHESVLFSPQGINIGTKFAIGKIIFVVEFEVAVMCASGEHA